MTSRYLTAHYQMGAGPTTSGFVVESIGLAPVFYTAALIVGLLGVRMFLLWPDLIPDRKL